MKQHAFACLRADWLTVPEHPAINESAGEHVHPHIPAAVEGRRELLHHLVVVGTEVALWFDVDRTGLSSVLPRFRSPQGHDMRMIKSEARRPWHERDAVSHAAGRTVNLLLKHH